jgi:hypothetical protein
MSAVESMGTSTPPEMPAPPAWGYPPPVRAADPRRKQPLLACVLSLMPGLGQIYVGYYRRGFVHAVVVGTLLTILASGNASGMQPLVGMFLAFFWLYNVIDAGRRAALYNYALDGIGRVDLPEDLAMPGMRGSIAGGLALIAIGGILLSNTLFDVSLRWLEDYWPLAPILFGVYLVGKALLEGKPTRPA